MLPLQRTTELKPPTEELITAWMQALDCGREEAIERMAVEAASTERWINDLYQVEVRNYDNDIVQINIRRRDGNVIFRDWRHFEAIELYPAESRLVDTSNKYHLWGSRDQSFRFPFGWTERDVRSEGGAGAGLRQRPITSSKQERRDGKAKKGSRS